MKKSKIVIFTACASSMILAFCVFSFRQQLLSRYFFFKAEETSAWNIETSEEDLEKIRAILQKPLRIFGYGTQCFAYTSDGSEYAVKICRASRYRKLFPGKGKRRKENDFQSYFLAFQSLQEQSQVVFIHLNKTNVLNTTLEVVDPWGVTHFLNADDIRFYIQRKAVPLQDYLVGLPVDKSKVLAGQILQLFKSCCEKGLQFRDIYPKNIGVCDEKPFWIDPGRITPKESFREGKRQEKAMRRFTALLTPFLSSDFATYLEEELEASF